MRGLIVLQSLLGQKYGYCPLPSTVSASEMDGIVALLSTPPSALTRSQVSGGCNQKVLSTKSVASPASPEYVSPNVLTRMSTVSSFSGWLTKRGHFFKTWHQRYFVLDGSTKTLSYFATEALNQDPKGKIFLVRRTSSMDATIAWPAWSAPSRCLALEGLSNGRTKRLYLVASCAQEAIEWALELDKVLSSDDAIDC